ncbi:unnamed protein product, partial [Rotaria sp. Silwood2]
LLLILQQTFANNCHCSCCTSFGCEPQPVGSFSLWLCTVQTCRPEYCVDRYHQQCPPVGAHGNTTATCRNNGTERLLPPLLIVIGITSIILTIKNKL